MADTELQQLIIYVGTTAQIQAAQQAGTITENDLAISTDAPDFQEKLTDVQMNAVNSGITTQLVSLYSGHVADTTIHVTEQNKTTWNNKQDTISDLSTIRSNAQAGKSASDTIAGYGNIVTHNVSEFATSAQGAKADSALQQTDIVNNTSSTATDKALSANMGKSLQDQVNNLKARGRFLALWNCATGLAQSNPPESPYTYQAGDYFIVGTISSADPAVNYKPNGSTYTTGVASVTVETNEVAVDDVYYYDGASWRLQTNTQKTLSFSNIAGDPYDNTNLASALNEKQDELTAGTGIDITNDTISNTGVRGVSTGSTNGTISVNTNGTSAEVAVAGLGTAAYTSSIDYATSAQGTKADNAIQGVKVNGTELTPDADKKVDVTVPTINSSNNYVPYRSSASAFSNSTLMYNSSAMAFTGKVHIGSTSPANHSNKGRLTIYDNTPSQQVSSLALLNYGGGGGCGVAIDMYNTSANGGIPSGRFGLIDNSNYSGFLQLQVKKSGAQNNPLLPAMNVVPLPASGSTTTCVSFGKDEYGSALFDLHKSEEYLSIPNFDQRWSGSGTTYYQTTNNVFGHRLIISVGDIVYFTAGTEATVTSVTSTSSSIQITTDRTLGTITGKNIYIKKAFLKITDENNLIKAYISPDGKFGVGTGTPAYDLDVAGTINASTDIKINGSSVALDSDIPTDTSELTNGAGYITNSALNGYATETWVGQQGFLTSTSLSGYATEQWVQNQGYLTGITSSDVISALGYTPYNSNNPNGYITNSALSNYVTTNTTQTITAQKTFKRTETAFQDSVARFVSTYISSTQGWRGRIVVGAKDYAFIIGTYNGMAAIGGHKFTDSSTESGAAWSDIYFQPDGDKAVYIGGYSWTQNSGWFKVQNNASITGGKVQVNTGTISSANWKDVAYKGENVKDFSFTSITGYDASKTQTLKHINGTLTWVDD